MVCGAVLLQMCLTSPVFQAAFGGSISIELPRQTHARGVSAYKGDERDSDSLLDGRPSSLVLRAVVEAG